MKPPAEQFEKLALDQIDTLFRVAKRLTRSEERAGDLVQETYLRAFRSRNGFHLKEHGIRPWLLRIMQNLHYSRSGRESRQPVAVEHEALEAIAPPAAEPVLQGLNLDHLDGPLANALEELPSEYRLVLQLWAVEELSYKEIAEAADIPIGTVMSRLYRARQRLSEALRSYALREGVIRE